MEIHPNCTECGLRFLARGLILLYLKRTQSNRAARLLPPNLNQVFRLMRTCLQRVFAVLVVSWAGSLSGISTHVVADEGSDFHRQIAAADPVAHWSFDEAVVLD